MYLYYRKPSDSQLKLLSQSQAKKLLTYQVLVKKLELELAQGKQKEKDQRLALEWDLQ
jgi:hypothetical protein